MQRFTRKLTEDGPDPSTKWGQDTIVTDTEDPDNENYMPIPDAGIGPAPGKTHARDSIKDWSDDDDDDCQVLEVLDPRPLAFSYPLPSTSADPDEKVHDMAPVAVGTRGASRKRAGTGPSDPRPSEASGPPKKKKKVTKKPGNKPRQRPTTIA